MKSLQQIIQTEQAKMPTQSQFEKRYAEMKAKGLITDEPTPVIQCDVCQDLGMVRHDIKDTTDPRFGKMYRCPNPNCEKANIERRRAWEIRIKNAQVPAMYQGYTFETWDKQLTNAEKEGKRAAYGAARLFVDCEGHWFSLADVAYGLGMQADGEAMFKQKNSIFMFGSVGTGKTGLAVATINELVNADKQVLYVRARDLIRDVQSRYGKENPSAEDVLESIRSAPILVIDEFNLSTDRKEDRLEIIETVMRHRYGNQLPTVMTANVDQKQFEDMWGQRTSDVTFAMAHWIHVGGEKLRRTENALMGV